MTYDYWPQSPKNIGILWTRILLKVLKSEEGLEEMAREIINLQIFQRYFQQLIVKIDKSATEHLWKGLIHKKNKGN